MLADEGRQGEPRRTQPGLAREASSRAIASWPDERSGGAVLVITEGDIVGKRIAVGQTPVVIGRGVGVDLQIADPTVSRHHCVVWCATGRCWVRDLGSTNQTRVNNRPARTAELFDGDVVVIGQTVLSLMSDRRRIDA